MPDEPDLAAVRVAAPLATTVLAYHERTKHHYPNRYAASLGYMDWDTQPDPFLRYLGAPLVRLPEIELGSEPTFDAAYDPSHQPSAALGLESIAQLLYDSLAISAWKQAGRSRWSLRCNPSSGNLHPTEAYLLLPAIPGLAEHPAIHHYNAYEHGLERRRPLASRAFEPLREQLDGGFMLALSSIPWREAWKYGERAYRYCQHDCGHAIAGIAFAAAVLGWQVCALELEDAQLERLLAIDDDRGPEAEHVDVALAIGPQIPDELPRIDLSTLVGGPALGRPKPLGESHQLWPVIDEVARACMRPPGHASARRPRTSSAPAPTPPSLPAPAPPSPAPARAVLRARRSAVEMDGQTTLDRSTFARMLERCMPGGLPFTTLASPPAIHPLVFVHQVDDVEPGLYVLVRDDTARARLKAAFEPSFVWRPEPLDRNLPLYLLVRGDTRRAAAAVSCGQAIAAEGCFALAMLAELEPRLTEHGPSAYRDLHWEAGALGQVLYLEAEATGRLRATGIGCFFDDAVHDLIGLDPDQRTWQVIYHFTLGGPVEDPRLQSLPAYVHRHADAS